MLKNEDESWDSEKIQWFKLINEEIAQENSLMSNRLNWFITSQAFLLTALSIAHRGGAEWPTKRVDFLFPLVPIIGVSSCLLILAGIVAGMVVLWRWRSLKRAALLGTDILHLIGLDITIITMGWSGPALLPIIFLVAWIYLLVKGV